LGHNPHHRGVGGPLGSIPRRGIDTSTTDQRDTIFHAIQYVLSCLGITGLILGTAKSLPPLEITGTVSGIVHLVYVPSFKPPHHSLRNLKAGK